MTDASFPNPRQPALLTRLEAARFLNLSPRKIDYLVSSGELPRIKIGSSVRFESGDLNAFILRHRSK